MLTNRTILGVIAAASLTAAIAVGNVTSAEAVAPVPAAPLAKPYWTSKPCAYEDSVNCYWDAGTQGNKGGQSFVIRKLPGTRTACIFYVSPVYAEHHDRCFTL